MRKKRIAVVDDELDGLPYSHLDADTQAFLDDEGSTEFGEVWEKAVRVLGVNPLGPRKDAEVSRVVRTNEFVKQVLLAPDLREGASAGLTQKLRVLWDRQDSLETLNKAIDAAFPSADFEVVRFSRRPAAADLLEYDLLLLDLVMGTASPIEDLIEYLGQLALAAAGGSLPSILLISNNETDLQKHRLRFRTEARISAAGLSILSKSQITSTEFAAAGLQLLWAKMNTQRPAAEAIRELMGSLEVALKKALQQTTQTLWNLDAGALQRIHLTSLRDNDPFEEHLHELVSKEHIWHVEDTSEVMCKIAALDEIFMKCVDGSDSKAQLTYSYATHVLEDLAPLRELIRHYSWSPLQPLAKLNELKVTEPATIARYLPFGSVIASEEKKDGVLLHLTQLCDLGKRDIFSRETSLIFLRARRKAYVQGEENQPDNDATQEVVMGLRSEGGDYDLVVDLSQLIAMPVLEFQEKIGKENLRVVARLRGDIAKQELLAASAHVTRRAAFRFVGGRAKVWKVKFILAIPDGGRDVMVYGGRPGTILDLSEIETDVVHFNDRHSFQLAVWLKQSLYGNAMATGIDFVKIADVLRLGLKSPKGQLMGALAFEMFEVADVTNCATEVRAQKARVQQLTVLIPCQR